MRPTFSILLKASFAAGSLAFLLGVIPRDELVASLRNAVPGWFVAGVTLQFLSRAMATVHMKLIAESQGLSLPRSVLFRILLAVQFYALFLPGTLAGGGVTWLKYLKHGASPGSAAAVVVLNRALSMLVLVPLGIACLLPSPVFDTLPTVVAAGLVVCAILCLGLIAVPCRPEFVVHLRALGRVGRYGVTFLERLLLMQRAPARTRLGVAASQVMFHLLSVGSVWCISRSVGAEVEYWSVVWIYTFLQAALLLPMSIAGIGIRDAGLIGLGGLVGVAASTAMAWSILILAGQLLVSAAGGLVEASACSQRLLRRAGPASSSRPETNGT